MTVTNIHRDDHELVAKIHARLAHEGRRDEMFIADLIRQEAPLVNDWEVLTLLKKVVDESTGLGVLEPLAAIPGVTDIVVSAPDKVFIDRGRGLEKTGVTFPHDDDVRQLATRLISSCGRRLDDAQPFADSQLVRADGTGLRIHALLSPPADTYTQLSIRLLGQARATMAHLSANGMMPTPLVPVLNRIIDAHKALLVTGGTGTGKTTLLSAMLATVDPRERILVIEDTAELKPNHPHVVSLVARGNNAEGVGAITMSMLLKQALRMRPDRIIVGEIRGAEVVDLLAALNTGHDGGAGTVHANSLREVPARLEALAALGGLDRTGLHSQFAAAIDVIISVVRTPQGRRLDQIGVVSHTTPVTVTPVWDRKTGPLDGWEDFLHSLDLEGYDLNHPGAIAC